MATFHTRRFEKEVARAMSSGRMKMQARGVAQAIVNSAHREMVEDFESHPVTKEIDSGPNATNTSGTLGGYGNLFSFIGFPAGDRPTQPIKNYLKRSARVHREPTIVKTHKDLIMKFKVDAPTVLGVEALSSSPWEGRSWTRGIERGISGLGHYMYSKSGGFGDDSRSRTAVQSSKDLRKMAYRPVKYITSILEKFYRVIR